MISLDVPSTVDGQPEPQPQAGFEVPAAGQRIVVGMGTRRGVRIGDVRWAMGECLAEAGVRAGDVVSIVTLDIKQTEQCLHEIAALLDVPLLLLSAEVLALQPVPNPSASAERLTGTPSVAEAGVLALGAELILTKRVSRGVAIALGRLPAKVQASTPSQTPTPALALAEPMARAHNLPSAEEQEFNNLKHHGDAELAPGLIDLAVNVRAGTPVWLRQVLRDGVDALSAYPNPTRATAAVAERHGRPTDQVLLTCGAAEAFVLLARALSPHRAVVVHPQFTEPEAALIAAGHYVQRVLLPPPFVLHPALVPQDADLVIIGNPTNPTSVLHPAATLATLARPGRVLVVDEAFMDAVPGEPESLAGGVGRAAPDLPGLVVVRSLTKTWSLAGLRIGYLLGDPELLAACHRVQPLWSVNSLALAAAIACSSPRALAEAELSAVQLVADRDHLFDLLSTLPTVQVAAPPRAPFLLLRVLGPDPGGVHQRLRREGWAVRRADTFPGLGPGWLRVAVRNRATSAAFVAALGRAVGGGETLESSLSVIEVEAVPESPTSPMEPLPVGTQRAVAPQFSPSGATAVTEVSS